jgi:phage terminase large subunit-like protein
VHDLTHEGEFFYSPARANHVIEFAENYCRHSKGKWGGKPVILELWEKAMLATIFGFIDIEGNRKYQEAILIIGKKNGKSLLASIVGLYLLIGDGEPGPEIYAVASKRDQAKIIWQEAKRMVRKSPALLKRIKTLVAELSSELYNDGVFKPLASDSDTLDGLNIHGALMDEFHQWKNGRPLYNIIADGTSAREQPLNFMTSTAGTIREDIYDEVYDEATMIINGYFDDNGYKDERKIAFIYELDNRKEWTDPKMWRKANPGLGTIKNERILAEKVERAKKNPALVKNLVCKEFNIRETSTEAWLNFDQLNNTATFDLAKLKPRYCIGGLDLSETTDLTCATIIFKVPGNEILYVHQMYWLPSDLLEARVREDKIPYDKWHEQGLLRVSQGNKINYKDVTDWFLEVQNELDIYVYKIGYDSWNSVYIVDELKQNFGKDSTEPIIQGKKTMSSPMKTFAADLGAKRINYNNNPILKWNLSNAAIDVDKNNNISLIKTSNQRRRIDGVASLLDAYICLERHYEEYMNLI